MKRFLAITTLVLSAVLFFAAPVFAQEDTSIIGRINAQVPCMKTGSCTSLDSILAVFAQISQWLLGIAGSVMLLMFVWGGAEWVFSAGESGRIKSGKGKMTNAVIGILLMFGALAIVRSIKVGLIGENTSVVACVVDSDCNQTACGGEKQPKCTKACFGGQCIAKSQADLQSNTTLNGCTTTADCKKKGEICLLENRQSTQGTCMLNCESLKGACQASACPTNKIDLGTNGQSLMCGEAFPETAHCCSK